MANNNNIINVINNGEYDKLEKLTSIFGPCGLEREVQDYFSEIMKPVGCKIAWDGARNYYAGLKGDSNLPRVMITAHADSVGFMINHIDDRGFIFTKDLGPWGSNNVDYRSLPTNDVICEGRKNKKKYHGHFGLTKPFHSLSEDEVQQSIDRIDLTLDIGTKTLKQSKCYVDRGDYAAFGANYKFSDVNSKDLVTGTFIDDRVGLFCMYRIAKEINQLDMKKRCPVIFVSTVSEEADLGSARTAANNLNPDVALVLDTTIATDQIRENNEDTIAKEHGDVSVYNLSLPRGPAFDNDLFEYLEEICIGRGKKPRIPYQVEAGGWGTESGHIRASSTGVETAAILIPVRNIHTRVETAAIKVIESAIELGVIFCKRVSNARFKPKSFYSPSIKDLLV